MNRRLASFVATAVFLLACLPHVESAEHSPFGPVQRVFLEVCGPTPSVHLEVANSMELPHCDACLQRLKTVADSGPAKLSLPVPPRAYDAPPRTVAAVAQHPPRLAPARGPPSR